MGNCCANCKQRERDSLIVYPDEEEIEFPQYSSFSDEQLECLEKENNFFRFITLIEYINLLAYFTLDTATLPYEGPFKLNFSSKDEFLSNYFYEELFQSFIENAILKDREIGEEETIFKEMNAELFKSLKLKLKQNYNEDISKKITKRDLISLGILFCKTSNISKIKVFFDIFKNENEEFVKSKELDEYLLSCFLISSYCMISAKKKLSQINPSIPGFSLEELKELLQFSELKDCQNLVKYFNDTFFTKNSFSWKEFKIKFKENGFGWIFSTKGIRQKLQENNKIYNV